MKVTFTICLIAAFAILAEAYFPETPLRAGSRRRPKIVGGKEAVPHSVPYQVGLLLGKSFCGGSLISERYVLTAAHCGEVTNQPVVVLGAHRVTDKEPEQVVLKAEWVYVHRGYMRGTLDNDIALVKLPEKAPLNDKIKTVRLTEPDAGNYEGVTAKVTGWGRAYDFAPGISPVLRVVNSTVMTNEDCQNKFGFPIGETVLCLDGSRGKSSCNGDSGGPLVVENDDEVTQIGVVSFGSSAGCEKGFPSAYTRLTDYIYWIKKHSDYE